MTGCPLLDNEFASRQNGKRLPCERLAEENERLHAQIRRYVEDGCDLIAENERLRELVADMWHDLQVHGYKVENMLNARYGRRMRELWVEV